MWRQRYRRHSSLRRPGSCARTTAARKTPLLGPPLRVPWQRAARALSRHRTAVFISALQSGPAPIKEVRWPRDLRKQRRGRRRVRSLPARLQQPRQQRQPRNGGQGVPPSVQALPRSGAPYRHRSRKTSTSTRRRSEAFRRTRRPKNRLHRSDRRCSCAGRTRSARRCRPRSRRRQRNQTTRASSSRSARRLPRPSRPGQPTSLVPRQRRQLGRRRKLLRRRPTRALPLLELPDRKSRARRAPGSHGRRASGGSRASPWGHRPTTVRMH